MKSDVLAEVVKGVVIGVAAVLIVALVALISGTILWAIWPIAIPAAFPGLVASGVLAARLAWWESVCLSWLCGIIFGASRSAPSTKKA